MLRPKNWFREHPVLGMNFVFWVIVHGIADGAFKGISSVDELLSKQPPPGRESFTLQWTDHASELPFFRKVTSQGPEEKKGLTFSSLHYNFTSLAERDGFKDRLRVHGIRAGVANKIDCITPYIPHPSSPADNIVQIRRPRLHVAKGLTTRIMTRFLSISLNWKL